VDTTADFIHREIFQLCSLVAIAVVAFLLTRAVAANNDEMRLRDAADWYQHGEQAMTAGRVGEAIDAFRRATVRDRGRKAYVLALARALSLNHDEDSARRALLAVREATPEDPDVNLELARLAAANHDVDAAARFYHNALYAPWPPDQTEIRRGVRIELIRFLLSARQTSRASAELIALATDMPNDPSHHLEVARLFVRAGDNAHALDHFERVLGLDPDNSEALAGAGLGAFRLGRYALAQRYLRRAPAGSDDLRRAREVTELVLTRDPLADRIGSAERRRRLLANFTYAATRLAACAPTETNPQVIEDAARLDAELRTLEPELHAARLDQDTIETAADLVDRVERHVVQRCGPPAPLDDALILVGRQHGSAAA
jgi:Tfp pilus assembly protein PilF